LNEDFYDLGLFQNVEYLKLEFDLSKERLASGFRVNHIQKKNKEIEQAARSMLRSFP